MHQKRKAGAMHDEQSDQAPSSHTCRALLLLSRVCSRVSDAQLDGRVPVSLLDEASSCKRRCAELQASGSGPLRLLWLTFNTCSTNQSPVMTD